VSRSDNGRSQSGRPKVFTITFASLVAAAAFAGALFTPLLAVGIARLGFHFPFSRIFDRVVMASLIGGLLWQRHRLKLSARLERGFAYPRHNFTKTLRGLLIGITAIAGLSLIATFKGSPARDDLRELARQAPTGLAASLAVGVIEEGFFRAFLLDGLAEEWGTGPGLVASAAIYAAAHLVRRRPQRQVAHLEIWAGVRNLESGLRSLAALSALAGFLGLFLLGLVLGLALQKTGTVYFSTGLHAGLVFGLRSWRYVAPAPAKTARWIGGYGWPPLVSGLAAWTILIAALFMIRPLSGASRIDVNRGRSSVRP
jgi:membrane protease YdiL (CAAX protease family)